jgi:tRNA A-37 threonylcarbamoyl transferase component Bud32
MTRPDPLIGKLLGGSHRLIERIGAGGFGQVYKARHEGLRVLRAVKLLRGQHENDAEMADRFQREARLTASLKHPHIVQIHDFGRDEACGLFFVMELLEGEPLDSRIERGGPMEALHAVRLARQIAAAFAYAHDKGVVHRDLKSPNVFLVNDEVHTDFAKVLDFGIARLEEPDEDHPGLTKTGAVMGSPPFMAPEQALGMAVDARTDIYAFGILLFEMLTGRLPFVGKSTLEVLLRQVSEAPPVPSEQPGCAALPSDLEWLVLKCLAKSREDRVGSARELGQRLEDIEARLMSGVAVDRADTLDDLKGTMVRVAARMRGASEDERRALVGEAVELPAPSAYSEVVGLTDPQSPGAIQSSETRDMDDTRVHPLETVEGAAGGGDIASLDPGQALEVAAAPRTRAASSMWLAVIGIAVVVAALMVIGAIVLPRLGDVAAPPGVGDIVAKRQGASVVADASGATGEGEPDTTAADGAAVAAPMSWVVVTDPVGGVVAWRDQADQTFATPHLFQLLPEHEGERLVFSREGHLSQEIVVDLAKARAEGSLVVKLRPLPKKARAFKPTKPRAPPKAREPKPRTERPAKPDKDDNQGGWGDL